MAIYHLSVKIITRSKGNSAVAAAAYRAGETIANDYDGVKHDYASKRGITVTNQELWRLNARIHRLQNWLREETVVSAPRRHFMMWFPIS